MPEAELQQCHDQAIALASTRQATVRSSLFYSFRIAKIETEMGHYAELTNKLSSIMVREDEGPLEMLTDLGADCFAKAKVSVFSGKPCVTGRATCGGTN